MLRTIRTFCTAIAIASKVTEVENMLFTEAEKERPGRPLTILRDASTAQSKPLPSILFTRCESAKAFSDRTPRRSDAECVSICYRECGSVLTANELELCLESPQIIGCVFDVSATVVLDVDDCQNETKDKLVISLSKEKVKRLGLTQTSQHATLSEVIVGIGVKNSGDYKNCPRIYHAGKAVVAPKNMCPGRSQSLAKGTWLMRNKKIDLDVTSYFTTHVGLDEDLGVLVQLDGCPALEVSYTRVWATFNFRVTYLNRSCTRLSTCKTCAAGCGWCSWKDQAGIDPYWIEGWSALKAAKSREGMCGLSREMCENSYGRYESVCSVLANIRASICSLAFLTLLLFHYI